MSDFRRMLIANQTRAYEGYPLVISRSVALRYLKQYQMYGNSEQGVLPAGYTELEYIEATGTQYIDTGIKQQDGDEFGLVYQQITLDASYRNLFGAAVSGQASEFYISQTSSVTYVGNTSNDGIPHNTNKHTLSWVTTSSSSQNVVVDGQTYAVSVRITPNPDLNVMVFARNASNGKMIGKVYGYYQKRNGEYLINLVPAKNSSGVVGMYDTVSGQFFTNAGTGTFTAGPVLPTPTSPVEIESVGTKVGNKYAVQVAVNYDGGVVDLGSLNYTYNTTWHLFTVTISDTVSGSPNTNFYINGYTSVTEHPSTMEDNTATIRNNILYIKNTQYTTAEQFKQAMSGVMLYYQRATDETWTAPTLKTVYLDEPLRKVGDYADVLDYKNSTITRNVGVKVLDGTERWTYIRADAIYLNSITNIPTGMVYCTHLIGKETPPSQSERTGTCFIGVSGGDTHIFTIFPNVSSEADIQALVASEYAKGTPVIIYYPLATPVVESIVAPALPTMAGSTTYTTETAVKPSNMKGIF